MKKEDEEKMRKEDEPFLPLTPAQGQSQVNQGNVSSFSAVSLSCSWDLPQVPSPLLPGTQLTGSQRQDWDAAMTQMNGSITAWKEDFWETSSGGGSALPWHSDYNPMEFESLIQYDHNYSKRFYLFFFNWLISPQ